MADDTDDKKKKDLLDAIQATYKNSDSKDQNVGQGPTAQSADFTKDNPITQVTPKPNALAPAASPLATGQSEPTVDDLIKKQEESEAKIKENDLKQEENIAKAEAEKAKKAAARARSDGEIDLRYWLLKAPDLQQIPYKPTTPTNPIEQWGSAAMVFAMLGSLFTRQPAVTAMNAAAGVMNGFKQRDEAAAKQNLEEWKVANANMLKAAEFQQKAYEQIFKNRETEKKLSEIAGTAEEKEIDANLKALNLALQHENAETIRQQGGPLAVLRFLDTQKKNTATVAAESEKLQKIERDHKADQEYKALVDSGKWEAMTPEERDNWTASDGTPSPAAESNKKSKLAEQHRIDEQVKAAENTPEYAAAVKSGDFASQLAIKAEAGSPQAEKELTKLLAKQAAQKMDGSVSAEDMRMNDEAIANYASPPPPQSTRNKEAEKLYLQTMARVRKINPSYDPSAYNNAVKIRQHWQDASNKAGGQIQTYNTITHHLNYLDDMVDALDTGDQATLNRAGAAISAALGDPKLTVTDVKAAQRAIAEEITKGIIGSQGALMDRDKMAELFDPTQSISVFKDNIRVLKDLVGGRFAAAQKSFEAGTKLPKEEFWNLLEDDTKRAFAKELGIPEKTVPKKPSSPQAAPAPAAPAPAKPKRVISTKALEDTATTHGVTVDQVKKALKAKDPTVVFEGEQ